MLIEKKHLPNHVLNAIKGVRTVSVDVIPSQVDSNGRKLCKWCLAPLYKKSQWCSDNCLGYYLALASTPEKIYERDKGLCRICLIKIPDLRLFLRQTMELFEEAAKIKRRLDSVKETVDKEDFGDLQAKLIVLDHLQKTNPFLFMTDPDTKLPKPRTKHAHEIDHIIPVSDGGTSTAENLRLLCIGCHREITEEWFERNKKAKLD